MQTKKIISGVLLGLSLTLSGALISSAEEIDSSAEEIEEIEEIDSSAEEIDNNIENIKIGIDSEFSQNNEVITPYAVHERWVSGIEKVYYKASEVEQQVYYWSGDWGGILNLVSTKPGYNPLTGKSTVIGIYEGWIHPRK
ncbi:hypothetical protein [Lysinibacillus tabacifolii]|uniref:Uncharacterized protein n=1 Tax=Lysinibacillus tabacifolii TaxID=1173107 RepID=A0ABY2SYY2_9BACI|nr:hypothetical protein [Lysinibacillus tabacifolii]TKI48067.1 hypothetical protein FC748_10530 [Lysinibacillus tabacifolii]